MKGKQISKDKNTEEQDPMLGPTDLTLSGKFRTNQN